MPGMDVRAALTVVGDGPVGPGRQSTPRHADGTTQCDWAMGMKFVIELPDVR